jgi:hypothetical protein
MDGHIITIIAESLCIFTDVNRALMLDVKSFHTWLHVVFVNVTESAI